MNESEQRHRVWEIIRNTHICMFVTHGRDGLRARPLDARPNENESAIYFLTDIRGSKGDEIEDDAHVCLIFVNEKEKAYLSITCTATIKKDTELAIQYWKKADEVWWPARECDPNLRVIRVIPEYAELWDGPADPKIARREFALAHKTGSKPHLGEEIKIAVSMSDK